ncbi:MAG: ATP-binding protein [Candidatus Methylumidiphilus sp.]
MPPKFQRLLTDWKLYASLVSAVLTGGIVFLDNFTEIVEKLQKFGIKDAITAKIIIVVPLGLLAVIWVLAALARRSRLLRPDRFLISADNPCHLVGREDRIEQLAEECDKNSLVILKGESGSGKSALVLAGLLPYLDPAKPQNQSRHLLPVRIDASGLDWEGGLTSALAQSLGGMPEEQRASLGSALPPASEGVVFDWLSNLSGMASKRLLLVLDQIDDYFVAHREHFMNAAGVVVTPQTLKQANPDWFGLAELVRHRRVHLLLVCRSDADVLSALYFKQPTTFLLTRIETNLISPLLDEVSRADEKGEVVDDPESGWLQLKSRLLRELASGGVILPVQLTLALDSLRTFRYLTIAEYTRQGGACGLERLHVERHVRDLAQALGLDSTALVKALILLTTEDGTKTQRVRLEDFSSALSAGFASADLETLIDHLERSHILRRQSSRDGTYLLLYHDYLARGVREAFRQANRWVELLRFKAREFDEALSWRQHWQALLPLTAQIRLLIERLRGRFNYGAYRQVALWSLLAFAPVLAGLTVAGLSGNWVATKLQEQEAVSLVNRLVNNPSSISVWRDLAKSSKHTRIHVMHQLLLNVSNLHSLSESDEILIHSVIGFDADGRFSRRILSEVFIPSLSLRETTTSVFDTLANWSKSLNLRNQPEIQWYAVALVKRMENPETKDNELNGLSQAFVGLKDKLDDKTAPPLAAALVKRMENPETKYNYDLESLGEALVGLKDKLEGKDIQPGAAALVKRMENSETKDDYLESLGKVLAGLKDKLEGKDIQPGAAALVARINRNNTKPSEATKLLTA